MLPARQTFPRTAFFYSYKRTALSALVLSKTTNHVVYAPLSAERNFIPRQSFSVQSQRKRFRFQKAYPIDDSAKGPRHLNPVPCRRHTGTNHQAVKLRFYP